MSDPGQHRVVFFQPAVDRRKTPVEINRGQEYPEEMGNDCFAKGGIFVETAKGEHPIAEDLADRIERLLAALTLREKISLLSGLDDWRTVAI